MIHDNQNNRIICTNNDDVRDRVHYRTYGREVQMTVEAIKSNIEYLIEQYEQSVLGLEEDISDSNGIGSNYLIGQLRANKEIIEHLRELIDESNYDEEEQHD